LASSFSALFLGSSFAIFFSSLPISKFLTNCWPSLNQNDSSIKELPSS
jgi:hypothetical protein